VSEAKEKFTEQPRACTALNTDMKKQLRQHHFTLEETNKMQRPNYFETVKSIDFNNKGDPTKIRSQIPQEVKADLRACHFRVGFDGAQNQFPQSNRAQSFRPGTAYSRTGCQPILPTYAA
jgi:hypothetical protein